ncbi:MAG: response regulator [Syntrophobacteraceae bacterium]
MQQAKSLEGAFSKVESAGPMKLAPRILIVDDSPTIRTALRRELEKMGAIVTEASDGRQGLETAKSRDFDLIITDIEMPRMNGFTLCEKLKAHHEKKFIPIIILSSKDQEEDIEHGFKLGISGYVSKSNAKEELADCVREVFDRSIVLRGRMILVVDDSPSTRNLIEKALSQAGFNVMVATNGTQALRLLDHHRPDLILSDLHMPEMDGYGLCKSVHAIKSLCGIPFVIMSSDGDRASMRRRLQYGASAYLVKPFNIHQLVVTTERLLSDHFRWILKERERLEAERQLIIGSITSLVLALEARDQYTRGHSDSVATILMGMGQEMAFEDSEIEKLKIAGKLHDLGKIGIRDDILLKPGPLTQEEMEVLKLHPGIGAEILSPIPSLADIIPAIASHHERIDGRGYPEGLRGDKISLFARMVAVADTYDALTSDRPYRKGFSHDEALTIMEEAKGAQLCPDCLASFLGSVERKMKQ